MSVPNSVELYADISSVVPGQPGVVRWWVLNCAAERIVRLKIILSAQDAAMASSPDVERQHPIEPNSVVACMQSLRVSEHGCFPFNVSVTGMLEGGRRFFLLAEPMPVFDVIERDGGGTLDLKLGSTSIATNLNFERFKHVKIEASGETLIDGKTLEALQREVPANTVHARPMTKEALAGLPQLPLRQMAPEGTAPLDFVRYAAAWPGKRDDLALHFVNAKGVERGTASEVGFSYRLRVQAARPGFLTLLARDVGGKYYMLAPNDEAPQARVDAHQAVFLPGALLPSAAVAGTETLIFNTPGDEMVLALLTEQQLFWQGNALAHWSEAQIADILVHAINMPAAVLAFAQIRVVLAR